MSFGYRPGCLVVTINLSAFGEWLMLISHCGITMPDWNSGCDDKEAEILL